MNIPPNIITTLVGGPCDGQEISSLLFDGRTWISAFKQVPAQVTPYEETPPTLSETCSHHYNLREGRYPNGRGYVVFAHPDLSDAEVFQACETLLQRPPTDALWDLA